MSHSPGRSDSSAEVKEKEIGYVDHLEKGPQIKTKGLTDEERQWLSNIDPKEANRIYHKVDRRLVPMLALLYLIAHLDRANIGNVKIEGLEASLGMTGSDYNIALVIFFIPYILCEVPSNMLLSKFKRPSVYIGILVTCWGTIMTLSGTTGSFAGLLVTRFLIGVFEAGFFPGAM
ncbi:Putative major facilitator superfamily, MFS transporter superfamily [Septoria linicola]|uniref:Major facilitator superfamily, MFS transporter superfamily n=1 Tax=Septoria linicola TaxID=215465 RepID=A0A9Q9AYZ5_9PEZI|nr:Putative major facilitator superfamily, MFS transporter superfamily [Septoria linicola]